MKKTTKAIFDSLKQELKQVKTTKDKALIKFAEVIILQHNKYL